MWNEPEEKIVEALGRLPREKVPPAHLEQATVASLRRAGLLRTQLRTGFGLAAWALAASIGAIAFVGGSVYATRQVAPVAAPEPTFALLLYGASTGDDTAAHAVRAAEYATWANAARTDARIVGGEALGMPVAAVAIHAARHDSVIVEEVPDGLGDFVGYFLVRATDREAAVRLAKECPHLRHGGRVVVRRVWTSEATALATAVHDTGMR